MNDNPRETVIVGAGVAGLTLAYKLGLAGKDVLLIEKEPDAGGLAKSFNYNGYTFDIGPHRFHTDIPGVIEFVKEALDGDYLTIQRKSGVWMFGKYFEWPLSFSALLRMPVSVLIPVGMDLLRRRRGNGKSFESYILQYYGETLYKIFFKPYTEKFLGMSCTEISKDWAVTGIERAVIDKNIRADSLSGIMKSLFSRTAPLKYIYPKNGGVGEFSKKLMQKIVNNNSMVKLNSEITDVVTDKGNIRQVVIHGERYDCDRLIWTGTVSEILHLLGYSRIDLEYLSLILFNYQIKHMPCNSYQWCYFSPEDIPFNRVSTPLLFNPLLAPKGQTGICVEVTCRKGDSRWEHPEAMEPAIRKSLLSTGLVKSEKDILAFKIERITNAYPVYTMNYKEKLNGAFEILSGFKNLRLLGRTGTFWYNNMDHSIHEALNLSREIIDENI